MNDEDKGAVHVYVDVPTHDAFLRYLGDLGLEKKSPLGCLLVAREFKLQRLGAATFDAAPTGQKKISVYLGRERKHTLEKIASPLVASEALSRLIKLELQERWLLDALAKVKP